MSGPIERDYLEALRERVTVQVWSGIVNKAVELAESGDPQARAWITKLVLGLQPMSLTALAVRESLHVDSFGEIEARAWETISELPHDALESCNLLGLDIETAQRETARAERRSRRHQKLLAAENEQNTSNTQSNGLGQAQEID